MGRAEFDFGAVFFEKAIFLAGEDFIFFREGDVNQAYRFLYAASAGSRDSRDRHADIGLEFLANPDRHFSGCLGADGPKFFQDGARHAQELFFDAIFISDDASPKIIRAAGHVGHEA